MTRSRLARKAFVAVVAGLLVAVSAALGAEAPRKGGVLRVGNLGEPPALDARRTTASITETLTNDTTERVRFYKVWLEK